MAAAAAFYDAVIVGAGVAGLTAGYTLAQNGRLDFQILEASSRYGGRVRKIDDFAEFPVDIGAGWLHPNAAKPNRVVLDQIIDDQAVTAVTQVQDYNFYYFDDGVRIQSTRPVAMRDEVFIGSTWFDFIETYLYPWVQDAITYDCIVDTITYGSSDGDVRLDCKDGREIRANKVIVTASVEVVRTGQINFEPPLPQDKMEAMASYDWVRVIKGFIEFSDEFYAQEQSFEIYPPFYGDDNGYLFYWDATDRQVSSKNVLGVLIEDQYVNDFVGKSDAEILSILLKHLDTVYNGKASASYIKSTFKNWADEPYILGGWTRPDENNAQQFDSRLEILAAPVGDAQVYFAGEHMPADGWGTTVPGAALSGKSQACNAMGGTFNIAGGSCAVSSLATAAPTPTSSSAPVAGICFSGNAIVELAGGKRIPMKQLKIGNQVKIADDTFEPVYSFGHWDPQIVSPYLSVRTTDFEYPPLEISRDHMVFVADHMTGIHRSIPASSLKIGDALVTTGTPSTVQSMTAVYRKGAFAPFTLSGKIIVNGIQASNYISMQEDASRLMLGGTATPLTHQWLSHASQGLHRMWFQLFGTTTAGSSMVTGMSTWVDIPYKVAKWLLHQDPLVVALVMIPTVASLSLISFLELVFNWIIDHSWLMWLIVFSSFFMSCCRGKEKKFPLILRFKR